MECSDSSKETSNRVPARKTVDHTRTHSLFTKIEVLHTSEKKRANREILGENETRSTSDSTPSPLINNTVTDDNLDTDSGSLAPVDNLPASPNIYYKRTHSSSVEDEMVEPPPKKRLGLTPASLEPLTLDETGDTADLTHLLPLTAMSNDSSNGFLGFRSPDDTTAGRNNNGDYHALEDNGGIQEAARDADTFMITDISADKVKKHRKRPKLDWYGASRVFADSTLKSKICGPGMEEFLIWEGIDIGKEFPKGRKYEDANGKSIARVEAMKNMVQEVHQAYIDARNAGTREVPLGWTGSGFDDEAPSSPELAPSLSAMDPISPASASKVSPIIKPGPNTIVAGEKQTQRIRKSAAPVLNASDGPAVLQTRIDLTFLHRQALEQLSKAYEHGLQDIAASFVDPINPIISAEVERLVFGIVDCEIRLRMVRLRYEHDMEAAKNHAYITSEMHGYRAQLVVELQRTIKWERGEDPLPQVTRLVVELFPTDF